MDTKNMTYQIINVATKEDLKLIDDFVNSVKFNTKDNHIPLHDPLFNQDGINFDITTYGDMTKEIVDIFEKYTVAIQRAVSQINKVFYDPPILGKSYIVRYTSGNGMQMSYNVDRPNNVFRSIVKWNDSYDGGLFKFKNYKIGKNLIPGDCIIFPENKDFAREITTVQDGNMFISDFWNAPVGQSPYPGLKYDDIYWGNPLWENR
jgi:hypothetical protein